MNLTTECKNAKKIGISGHIRPDGDCVGSTLALSVYLKKVVPQAIVKVFLDKPTDIFKDIQGFDEIDSTFTQEEPCDVFFALDCSKDRLGDAEPIFDKAAVTINIDHHISNEYGTAKKNVVKPAASSTCEVIYQLIEEDENGLSMDEKMDKEIAMALYIGMIHDTGVFQYSNTTPTTLKIAAELIKYDFNFSKLIEETFYQKTYIQNQIMGRALLESMQLMDGKCIVSLVDKKTMDFYGVDSSDLDGIVNQLRNIKGVACAVFMYQTDLMEYKISMRSNELVNVAQIASYFGGGGHVRAAGCTMKGTFHDCINNLTLHIEKQLKEE